MKLILLDIEVLDNTVEVKGRRSAESLMPVKIKGGGGENIGYNKYPVSALGKGRIFNGYGSLAKWIVKQKVVVIDGYVGLYWKDIAAALHSHIVKDQLTVNWIRTDGYLKEPAIIDTMIAPFLGTADSVWGKKCSLQLEDLYQKETLASVVPDPAYDINIVVGTAAALAGWNAAMVYIDLPKNELQFRMRAGAIHNLGADQTQEPAAAMYKRFYFVDWVLLNEHKQKIFDHADVIADGQWPDDITWMEASSLNQGLEKISRSVIRVRPWFEPGVWGGQWIKKNIPGVNKNAANYAWSFELIVPENGLVFESDGFLLEVSFDILMYKHHREVLGKHADRFGYEFPIRFDFLDTFEGDNLSVQCHPRLDYIKHHFGEQITQDETYYILDCEQDASVYLGFQDNIQKDVFRSALIESQKENREIDITDFVQVHRAKKHDLFLIPSGTVHSAGAGNLVLEISATPYIFTFKMYDWLRPGLDGNPRPINIEHAFNNLDFQRKGESVLQELISRQEIMKQGPDYSLIHLPTHAEHFYDVHRMDFDHEIHIETQNGCHVLMLVEGDRIRLETADGNSQEFAFAETFVIPAAAGHYKLTNLGTRRARVIKAYLK